MSKAKTCLVALALGMAAFAAPIVVPAAHADQIYHEFPIGQTGRGNVCVIDTDARTIVWYWYDANGGWGILDCFSY